MIYPENPEGMLDHRVERRHLLVGAAAALFVSWLPIRVAATGSGRSLEVGDLVEAAHRLKEAHLVGGDPNETAYVNELASAASRLGPVPKIELGPPFRDLMRTGIHRREGKIVLIEWHMDAGAIYPAHNHPNYNGLTVGLEGTCRIRNFQAPSYYPPTDSPEPFVILETQNQWLTPGRVVSMMTSEQDNIHKLHAETSVRGLDISTLVGDHVGFGFMDVDESSRNERGEYEAVWERSYGGYSGG